ncbi:MAG: hypothetical protein AAGC92_11340 [Pseudomonadota bacterium]
MRSFVLAAVLAALPAGAAAESLNQYFEEEMAVPIRLSSGVTVTLRAVDLVNEDLGRRLVLRADFDGPRPPSTSARQIAVEADEAKELCQRHLSALSALLSDQPSRRITHLEVLYRDTKTHYRVDVHAHRGMRVDTRRHRCPGA